VPYKSPKCPPPKEKKGGGSHPLFSPLIPSFRFCLHFPSTNVGRRSVVYEETARNPKNASTHASSLFLVSSLNPKTRATKYALSLLWGLCLCMCARAFRSASVQFFCVCGSDSGVRKKAAMEDAEVQAEGASSAPALASTQGRFSL
jgi:hypothetical protein